MMLLGAAGPDGAGAGPPGAAVVAGDDGVQPDSIIPTSIRRLSEHNKTLFFIFSSSK